MKKEVVLLSNGDFRESACVSCWPMQEQTLRRVEEAFAALGATTRRGHPYKPEKKHGFLNTQAEACRAMAAVPLDAPLVLVMSSWVWAHHLASSMAGRTGPILLLGNFDGTWPGLVALLNHAATYERMNIRHSRIWSDTFAGDKAFMKRLKTWLDTGRIEYPTDHITPLEALKIPAEADKLGRRIAADILKNKRIIGQFDPGCMGMLNAVFDPDLMADIGMPLELLSQSDLLAEMALVDDKLAERTLQWLLDKGTGFEWGRDEATELTRGQVIEQMRMYHAAGRMYRRYGLGAIGIAFQYGMVRCTSASDLPEGMLNNTDRPAIVGDDGAEVNPGRPIVHFNEGDAGSGVPQALMNEILTAAGMPPETTLHDVRWGRRWEGRFTWVLEISGGAPPAHFGGWANTRVYRQPPMYFPKGGGTCSGVSLPGKITWARFYQSFGKIGMDIGEGEVVKVPTEELRQRLDATTAQWPIANTVFSGCGRDEIMSAHKSNHVTICYGEIAPELAAAAAGVGIPVNIVGDARKKFQ